MLSSGTTEILASGVLLALALVAAAWFWRQFRRWKYTPSQFPLYCLNYVLTRVLWRASVEGTLELGPHQGAVIVCNHIGPIDPAFIALLSPRTVHWMVAEEYCRHPLVGWGLRTLAVIPTNRQGIDTAATKSAIRLASQGELVGMFPEGRINTSGNLMLPGRPGAVLVAIKARVPVVPCYLADTPFDGTIFGFFFLTARARLRVGRPLDLTAYYGREQDREVLAEATLRLLRQIARLAGRPDYVPELAGRRWIVESGAA